MTADQSEDLIGKALALGANDFIKKPLAKGELVARLNARVLEMSLKRTKETLTVENVSFIKSQSLVTSHNSKNSTNKLICLA